MNHRKRILLDVDGVLADFHTAARTLMLRLFGKEIPMEDFRTWDVTSVLPTQEMKDACNRGIAEPGFAASLDPFPEAQAAVKMMRADPDVEPLFVTTPHRFSKTWMHERTEWLRHHFDASHDEIFHCFRKYAVAGHLILDDKASNVASWQLHHPGHGLLWDTPYNRDEGGVRRVASWSEVISLTKCARP